MSVVAQISHQTDETLELYALKRLSEALTGEVEEHLLVCVSCQQRVDDLEAYALAMRQAIADEPATEPANPIFAQFRFPRFRIPTLAWAGVLVLFALVAGLYHPNGANLTPLASIQLTAIRGELVPSINPARKTDIVLTDAPAGRELRAEVVDASGKTVWNGQFGGSHPEIQLTHKLAPGNYFVRLYDANGNLMHEYGFRVRDPH